MEEGLVLVQTEKRGELKIPTREITIYLPGLTLPLQVVRDIEGLISDPADEENIPLWAEV